MITKVPLLGLCMIVKNESAVITELFDSISEYIDTYVISDTGSTDGTQDIIKKYFDKRGIPGHIYNDKWVDFGTNRTIAFQHCVGKMMYAWVMDADDLIALREGVPKYTKTDLHRFIRAEYADAYSFDIHFGIIYERPQIFKMPSKWKYIGVLHEYAESTIPNPYIKKIKELVLHPRTIGARSHMSQKEKYSKDAEILLAGLQKEPNNTRYMFYLAQSYRDAGNPEKAIEWYKKRVAAGGWEEEAWFALYQIGVLYYTLNKPDEATKYLNEAINRRPSRAEPYRYLALIAMNTEDYSTAYSYAIRGLSTPYPDKDVLFIEKANYDYFFDYIAAISASHIGKNTREHTARVLRSSKSPKELKDAVSFL
jgi:glycosyltransferase involved in cell wall biosynthesis